MKVSPAQKDNANYPAAEELQKSTLQREGTALLWLSHPPTARSLSIIIKVLAPPPLISSPPPSMPTKRSKAGSIFGGA